MGQKLKIGDKVKLSAHALKLRSESPLHIGRSGWQEGVKRNNKDTYIVQELKYDSKFVRLGNRTGKWYQRKEGPLTSFWLRRDWIKRAD